MRIDPNNEKVIIEQYPNQHPPIRISVYSQKEYNELSEKIDELSAILKTKKVQCKYQLIDETIIHITINNQLDQESILAVQQMKQELAKFVVEYNPLSSV